MIQRNPNLPLQDRQKFGREFGPVLLAPLDSKILLHNVLKLGKPPVRCHYLTPYRRLTQSLGSVLAELVVITALKSKTFAVFQYMKRGKGAAKLLIRSPIETTAGSHFYQREQADNRIHVPIFDDLGLSQRRLETCKFLLGILCFESGLA